MDSTDVKDRVLLSVRDLTMHFSDRQSDARKSTASTVRAVDGVSLEIRRGETLGLVGESGSGKSTLARAILQLHHPSSGQVLFEGTDLTNLKPGEMRGMRRRMQMIFQDPQSSLDPRMTVRRILREPMDVHAIGDKASRSGRVAELLLAVGLSPDHQTRYPHEFSGGQRQRIGIARALAVAPEFIVCDEPISSLDVSIRAQIVNLLSDLQDERGLSYLFIAHDLSVVRHISDRIAVMYLGKLMEMTDRETLFRTPSHPYTQALLSAIPVPDPRKERGREQIILRGDIPSPADPPSGCVFRTRCPIASDICAESEPEWRDIGSGAQQHWVACHFAGVEVTKLKPTTSKRKEDHHANHDSRR